MDNVKNSEHSFSHDEIIRRFEGAKGKTLGEIDVTGVFSGKPKNKGVAGAVIEQSVLGYPPDSRQEPDIEIDGLPYEVKTTGLIFGAKKRKQRGEEKSPLKRGEKKDLEAKEPMSITAVSVDDIWKEDFSDSAFWHKLDHMLVAYYLYNGGSPTKVDDPMEYASFPVIGYELHRWDDDDKAVLAADWQLVRDFIARVHEEGLDPDEEYPKISHELNRKLLYTDTSPKWPNKPRWRLKRSTVSAMVREHFTGDLEHLPTLLSSYDDIESECRSLRHDYAGATIAELAKELRYDGLLTGKSVAERIVVRMFGGHSKKMSRLDAFAKAGIQCKTITYSNGEAKLAEDIKFARVDFDEAMDETALWEGSVAQEGFTGRILCAIFEEPSKEAPLSENVFKGFKWVEFDDVVVEEARAVWNEVRRLIFSGELRDVICRRKDGSPIINKTGVPKSAPNFPKSENAYAVFIRGDGRDSTKKPLRINGIDMYLQYFWLKRCWVVQSLEAADFI